MYIARERLTETRDGKFCVIQPGTVIEDFARWPYVQQKPLLNYGYVEKVEAASVPEPEVKVSQPTVDEPVASTSSFVCGICRGKGFATMRGLRVHNMKVHGE